MTTRVYDVLKKLLDKFWITINGTKYWRFLKDWSEEKNIQTHWFLRNIVVDDAGNCWGDFKQIAKTYKGNLAANKYTTIATITADDLPPGNYQFQIIVAQAADSSTYPSAAIPVDNRITLGVYNTKDSDTSLIHTSMFNSLEVANATSARPIYINLSTAWGIGGSWSSALPWYINLSSYKASTQAVSLTTYIRCVRLK